MEPPSASVDATEPTGRLEVVRDDPTRYLGPDGRPRVQEALAPHRRTPFRHWGAQTPVRTRKMRPLTCDYGPGLNLNWRLRRKRARARERVEPLRRTWRDLGERQADHVRLRGRLGTATVVTIQRP